jgi:RNA polymerase sigma-54 factor
MKIRVQQKGQHKLSNTLQSWLPLLQCSLTHLHENLQQVTSQNPFCHVEMPQERSLDEIEEDNDNWEDDAYYESYERSSNQEVIESLTFQCDSLFDHLYSQIDSSLFPTHSSQVIARTLIDLIDEDGYFSGDVEAVASGHRVDQGTVERILNRFRYLTPTGVGARNQVEAMSYQIGEMECSDEVEALAITIASNLSSMIDYRKDPLFPEAMKVIKKCKLPPAIEFLESSQAVIPDIFIYESDGSLEVKLNDDYYPIITIEPPQGEGDSTIKAKLKEAKDLVDAVMMRKQTLYKLGLMIVEYQYEFFMGHEIKPMRLVDLSDDLGRNPSTVSRAIAGKYLACSRGIFPLKSFFSTAIDEDLSSHSLKDFIKKVVKNETLTTILSDEKILDLIEAEFKIKIVRRTITKYRKELDIPSSSERKKLLQMGL